MTNSLAARVLRLGLAIVLVSTAHAVQAADWNQSRSPAIASQAGCPGQPAGEPFARTELYLGLSRPDGSTVTPEEFQSFLDHEITPRFPEGLTLLRGQGQFRGASETIIQERSVVLILLYPLRQMRSSTDIETIRRTYKRAFQQESVLRVDASACVGF